MAELLRAATEGAGEERERRRDRLGDEVHHDPHDHAAERELRIVEAAAEEEFVWA